MITLIMHIYQQRLSKSIRRSKDYKKDLYFPNVLIRNLDQYTNSNIRESRDKSNNLNFYSDEKKLETIKRRR